MRALLLAAGLGTRLRPLTHRIPKCLVPVNGRPLMDYWMEILVENAGLDVLVNLHYLPGKVEKYISSCRFGNKIKTVYEKQLLGTGGTLLKNKDYFSDEPVMLVHADNLSLFNIHSFVKAHQERPENCLITMMTFETDSPQTCGIVELNEEGIVLNFHEKVKDPPGCLANGAVYIFEPEIFEFLENLGKETIDFSTEVLPSFIGRIFTFHNKIYHRDIGSPESYLKAQQEYPGRSN